MFYLIVLSLLIIIFRKNFKSHGQHARTRVVICLIVQNLGKMCIADEIEYEPT